MGTRSLTVMMDEDTEIAVLYRQFDGYPSGHGQDLANFLYEFAIVNGIQYPKPDHLEGKRRANGPDCLAAQLVAHFKKDVGEFYLMPAGTRDCGSQYIYTVTAAEGEPINLRCESVYSGDIIYDGVAGDFDYGEDD